MGTREKIATTLVNKLGAEYVRLEDGDGISGFVVSSRFRGMPALDRQELIEDSLTPEQRRQVLMIAAVTPEEYDSIGPRVRIHQIKPMAKGAIKVLLHGGQSDAKFVRDVLSGQEGVQTTEPKWVPGAIGALMSFSAKGDKANPLTKEKVIEILQRDPYIDVMANA